MLLDNLGKIIDDFLIKFYDSNKSDLQNWEHLFSCIEEWKTKYMITADTFTLHGIDGWWWDVFYCKFSKTKVKDYVSIMALICWSFATYARKNGYYRNWSFINPTLAKNNFDINSMTKLSRDDFFNEKTEQYQNSYERFEGYIENYSEVYPDVIDKLTVDYSRFTNFYSEFSSDINECSITRLNELHEDECAWYFIEEQDCIRIIYVEDFV